MEAEKGGFWLTGHYYRRGKRHWDTTCSLPPKIQVCTSSHWPTLPLHTCVPNIIQSHSKKMEECSVGDIVASTAAFQKTEELEKKQLSFFKAVIKSYCTGIINIPHSGAKIISLTRSWLYYPEEISWSLVIYSSCFLYFGMLFCVHRFHYHNYWFACDHPDLHGLSWCHINIEWMNSLF